jgi:diphosphomevalonate decarboxylase
MINYLKKVIKMKITAKSHSNIALVKYWGKRDEKLILPFNSSISMTLDALFTTTTVEFSDSYKKYSVIIDGELVEDTEYERVVNHLELIKKELNIKKTLFAKVVSTNNFPKKAGIASSASGFAALTVAAVKSLNKDLSGRELSIIARKGSGSASRSIHGGFVKWNKGNKDNGSDSYAEQVASEDHWPDLVLLVVIISTEKKKTSSRKGMKQTIKTSPLYPSWLETIEEDLKAAEAAIKDKNFNKLGSIAELNALKMHSTMLTTLPNPLIYWEPLTIEVMKTVISLREEGIDCYFTIDAGPQVKILSLLENVDSIKESLSRIDGIQKIIVSLNGGKTILQKEHLF